MRILLLGFCVWLCGMSVVVSGEDLYRSDREFSLRFASGIASGVGDDVVKQFDVVADFYFLSDQFRMFIGTTFWAPEGNLQPVVLQQVGVSYLIPLSSRRSLELGYAYFRPYILQDKKHFKLSRGSKLFVSYHYAMRRDLDFIVEVGGHKQPLRNKTENRLDLDDQVYYLNVGLQWYL